MDEAVRYTPGKRRHKVELVDDGAVVCSATIHDREMRLGDAWVRMGGIGDVTTKPQFRGRGYARRMLDDTVRFMRTEGYAVSVLFGISNFYHRFGFEPVLLGKSAVSVATRAAETLRGPLSVREGVPADGAVLLRIYEATSGKEAGAIKRTAAEFLPTGAAIGDWSVARVAWVAEYAGEPVAYALAEPEWQSESDWRLPAFEIAVMPQFVSTAGPSLLGALGADAARRRVERLQFELLPDNPLLGVLRPIGFDLHVKYTGNQGGMGRIIDLAALAQALTPTLQRRNAALNGSVRVGALRLRCGDEQAEIELGGGGPPVSLCLPQDALLQLMIGYRSIQELHMAHPACVGGEESASVAGLFPQRYPYTWAIDHF